MARPAQRFYNPQARNVSGTVAVYGDSYLSLAGGDALITASILEVQGLGTIRFEVDRTGDLSAYDSGGGTFEIFRNNSILSHKNPHNFIRNGELVGKTEVYSAQLVFAEVVH